MRVRALSTLGDALSHPHPWSRHCVLSNGRSRRFVLAMPSPQCVRHLVDFQPIPEDMCEAKAEKAICQPTVKLAAWTVDPITGLHINLVPLLAAERG